MSQQESEFSRQGKPIAILIAAFNLVAFHCRHRPSNLFQFISLKSHVFKILYIITIGNPIGSQKVKN